MLIYTRRQRLALWWDRHEPDLFFITILVALAGILWTALAPILAGWFPANAPMLALTGAASMVLALLLIVVILLGIILQEMWDAVQRKLRG